MNPDGDQRSPTWQGVRQYELVTDALDKQVARGFTLDPRYAIGSTSS